MDHRPKLVAVALLLSSIGAHATFVTPSSPAGFASGAAGMTLTPLQQLLLKPGSTVIAEGPRVAGSGATKAAYKLGAGAARALARATIAGGGAGAVALGAIWLADNCIAKTGQGFSWTCAGAPGGGEAPVQSIGAEWRYAPDMGWMQPGPACQASTGRQAQMYPAGYTITGAFPLPASLPGGTNADAYCEGVLKAPDGSTVGNTQWNMQKRTSSCPPGHYIIGDTCVQTPPPQTMTPQQVEDEMATKPLPPTLPPGVPYPIESPWFNPILDSAGNPVLSPSGNPQSAPLLVPQGQPQPVPNTDPQTWRQPITTVTPAPTAGDPWRMNVQPGEQTSTNPNGMTTPQSPTGTETDPKPTDDPLGLCDQYPDIVACAKLNPGELAPDPIANTDVPLAINPETGFPTGGQCPAPKTHVLMGRSFSFSIQPLCDFATMIKPLLIGFAWLMAAMTFMGIARREN